MRVVNFTKPKLLLSVEHFYMFSLYSCSLVYIAVEWLQACRPMCFLALLRADVSLVWVTAADGTTFSKGMVYTRASTHFWSAFFFFFFFSNEAQCDQHRMGRLTNDCGSCRIQRPEPQSWFLRDIWCVLQEIRTGKRMGLLWTKLVRKHVSCLACPLKVFFASCAEALVNKQRLWTEVWESLMLTYDDKAK